MYSAQNDDLISPVASPPTEANLADSSQKLPTMRWVNDDTPFVVAEADSVYQLIFKGTPAVLRKWAKANNVDWQRYRFPYSEVDPEFPKCLEFIPKQHRHWYQAPKSYQICDNRYIGDTAEFNLGHDEVIVPVLLVSMFLMIWITVASRHFLHEQIKEFFHTRLRKNLFDKPESSVFQGRWLVILQMSILLGILYLDFLQAQKIDYFSQFTPVVFLVFASTACFLYFVLQYLLFVCVNKTFFSPLQNQNADDSYFTAILLQSYVLLPLVLLSVFFHTNLLETQIFFLLLIAFIKLLFAYKLYRIFFPSWIGKIHLFLYFCSLEISPLVLLGLGLSAITHWLYSLL